MISGKFFVVRLPPFLLYIQWEINAVALFIEKKSYHFLIVAICCRIFSLGGKILWD